MPKCLSKCLIALSAKTLTSVFLCNDVQPSYGASFVSLVEAKNNISTHLRITTRHLSFRSAESALARNAVGEDAREGRIAQLLMVLERTEQLEFSSSSVQIN